MRRTRIRTRGYVAVSVCPQREARHTGRYALMQSLPLPHMAGTFEIDPLTGAPVLQVGHRQRRPEVPDAAGCPFCPGGLEAPEDYDVRVFPNRWPPLRHSEVVLYSPDHEGSLATIGVEAVRRVVDTWAQRSAAMTDDGAAYVLVFENRGPEAGATIAHPHGQIYGFDFVPPVPAREAEIAATRGCPVCAERDALADRAELVVASSRGWTAWTPASSAHPYELRLAPDAHLVDLAGLDSDARDGFAAALVDTVGRYDTVFGPRGGADAATSGPAQRFPYHMWIHPGVHLHVHFAPPLRAPGLRRFVASADFGSGVLANPVPPAEAAEVLRAAVRRVDQ